MVDDEGEQVRLGSGALLLAFLAFALALAGTVVLAVPAGLGAMWMGIRATGGGKVKAMATTGIILGAFAVLIAVGTVAMGFALEELGQRRMPGLVEAHAAELAPPMHAAAEEVYPCEGHIDGVTLRALYTRHPAFDRARPIIMLEEARAAVVDVQVGGATHQVRMDGQPGGAWVVWDRPELARACEALAQR